MRLSYTHESIRLTGRWDTSDTYAAVTTAPGSYIEFAFVGKMALLRFDIIANAHPTLHLWLQLDGGDLFEAPLDSHLRICAKHDGYHICRVIYKGGAEKNRRWYLPLTGKITFLGVEVDMPAELPEDTRQTVEFVGDSITEGVLIDDFFNKEDPVGYTDDCMRCYQDDVCATYAWLTAEALELRPYFMGYGGVGVTHGGCGRVPAAPDAYPLNFQDSPVTYPPCDMVIINHGANDHSGSAEEYLSKYAELLDKVIAHNPKAIIVALSVFCGVHREALGKMIPDYNAAHETNVHYIDTAGWIPSAPTHPTREGHRTVAEHLIPILKKILEKNKEL